MSTRLLTLRELNRMTLARQLLLERVEPSTLPVMGVIERLTGLQAQMAQAPYVGIWTRLANFQRHDLAQLIEAHQVVKATLLRSTLHLCTAADYPWLRAALEPVLIGGFEAISKKREGDLDFTPIVAAVRDFLAQQPRTFAEISAMLTERLPEVDVGAMRYASRMLLPLVQVPTDTRWSYPGNPQFALMETWLPDFHLPEPEPAALVRRYLAAFGPATITDMQKWSGLGGLKPVFASLKSELVTYRDERKRELFDLPDQPVIAGDTPAPVRFLPEFDNLLLGHDKRDRIVADEHKAKVYLPGLRVAATFLLDGFVAGVWKTDLKKKVATLALEPFAPLTAAQRADLTEEGERLLRFIEPDARDYRVELSES